MSKEQIEDMARTMCDACQFSDRKCSTVKGCVAESFAVHLYAEGYRKQREGEWTYSEDKRSMKCTHCRKRMTIQLDRRYCPNCGAKMKGGADDGGK